MKQKGFAVLEFSSEENKEFAYKHEVNYYNQRIIWEKKTTKKEKNFEQQDFKSKSEIIGDNSTPNRCQSCISKMGTTRKLNILSSTSQKLDSHSIYYDREKGG
ncbi:24010_t:CDS:2 [Gigaspora rosea]|nr:24010_t:CDS:2 [Gigaspora rosea]